LETTGTWKPLESENHRILKTAVPNFDEWVGGVRSKRTSYFQFTQDHRRLRAMMPQLHHATIQRQPGMSLDVAVQC